MAIRKKAKNMRGKRERLSLHCEGHAKGRKRKELKCNEQVLEVDIIIPGVWVWGG